MLPEPNRHWRDSRYDYAAEGQIAYAGMSQTSNASTSVGELWLVWKYTWTTVAGVPNISRVQGPVQCNWDERDSQDWG